MLSDEHSYNTDKLSDGAIMTCATYMRCNIYYASIKNRGFHYSLIYYYAWILLYLVHSRCQLSPANVCHEPIGSAHIGPQRH